MLKAVHNDLETKLFKVRKELEAADEDYTAVAKRIKAGKGSNTIKTPKSL